MDVDVARDARVGSLLAALPGSELRGSLADGGADALSDIDLVWACGPAADTRLAGLPSALARVTPTESVRLDPDTADDPLRRLVFVRFAEWPLWQRVDLELVGTFRERSAPWAEPWDAAESALMNVLGAIKASRRARGDVDGLLARGFARVGAVEPAGASPTDRMLALVGHVVAASPRLAGLGARVSAEVDRPW